MKQMTTLTLDGETFEIVDKQAREDLSKVQTDIENANNHMNNDNLHVTEEEKTSWNDKYSRNEIDTRINNLTPRVTVENNTLMVNGIINDVSLKNNVLIIS